MTTRKQPIPARLVLTDAQRIAMVRHAREQREAAAALRAESRQARRYARALVEASNAILDSAVAITKEILERRRIALAEPVAARFRTDERGSTGIEITVRLKDPTNAAAARKALTERFGGEARCDRLIVS